MNFLEVRKLNAVFGNFKLKDIDFSLKENSTLVILGRNGTGKTKLLECLCGLQPIKSGSIILNNKDITQKKPQERKIGYIGSNFGLFPHMSIYENIVYGLKFNKSKINIDEIIDIFNLRELLNRKPDQISDGQKQRVALARTYLANPDIIFFDEPTSGISYLEKPSLLKEVKAILSKFNYTCLFVTHDISEAMFMADYVGVMQDGFLKSVQSLNEFLVSPSDTESAEFLGYNILKAKRVSNESLSVQGHIIKANAEKCGESFCLIRPDTIVLTKQPTNMDNCIKCMVVDFSFNGHVYSIYLDCGFLLKANLTKYYFDSLDIKIDQNVHASFSKTSVIVLTINS